MATADLLTWLTFGAMQVILLVFGGALLLRRPVDFDVSRGAILVAAGLLLILLDAVWFSTGGPRGESFIPMRGGTLGAWLSVVTGAEVALIGLVALLLSRRS